MFLFICTGYAQVADTLSVVGDSSFRYEGVYITAVAVDSNTNLTPGAFSSVFPTNLKNTVTLLKNTATVKYKITVYNTSNRYTYTYKGIVCELLDGYNNDLYNSSTVTNNSKFRVTLTNEDGTALKVDEVTVKPASQFVFYATYTFGRNVTKNTALSFLLNYKFSIHIASMGEAAVEKTMEAFLDVLNTPENYGTLTENIDNKYKNEDWQANYIGNVSNTSGNVSNQGKADAAIVEGLLGSGLTLTVDGVTKNVTVLIKRENIDNNERTGDGYKATNGNNSTYGRGCEMTIYMTPNNLDKVVDEGEYDGTENDWGRSDDAEVFVSISTCTNNGVFASDGTTTLTSEWYQIGDIYAGIANIVTYDGGTGTGSFVTDKWKSLEKTYQVTENYSYNVAAGLSISTIVQAKDSNANAEFNRLLAQANAAISYIDANRDYFNADAFDEPIATLREITAKAQGMTVDGNTYRSTLIPILKSLESAIYPFRTYIGQ